MNTQKNAHPGDTVYTQGWEDWGSSSSTEGLHGILNVSLAIDLADLTLFLRPEGTLWH